MSSFIFSRSMFLVLIRFILYMSSSRTSEPTSEGSKVTFCMFNTSKLAGSTAGFGAASLTSGSLVGVLNLSTFLGLRFFDLDLVLFFLFYFLFV